MDRIILHIDMDAFFASVEERENPQFKGKPVVVGADPEDGKGRGVVSTANYEARKYGIHSALPISKAYQLCSQAIFLPVNMELYQNTSRRIMEIIKKYSSKWEIVSLDEAYLDISFSGNYQKAQSLAQKLKKEIFEKEKLTSAVGIGPNKLVAKMAAEKSKPDGFLMIKPSQVKSSLESLDIEGLPGIGPKTAEKLRAIKINKIKELKKLPESKLENMLGLVGKVIYERARGIDRRPVTSEEVIKSIGREHTFEKDIRDPEIIFKTFENLIHKVYQELIEKDFFFTKSASWRTQGEKRSISSIKAITVICRFQGFETHSKSMALKEPSDDLKILKREAKRLLLKSIIENQKLIRLIGLRVKIV